MEGTKLYRNIHEIIMIDNICNCRLQASSDVRKIQCIQNISHSSSKIKLMLSEMGIIPYHII